MFTGKIRNPKEAATIAMQALAQDFQKTDRILARNPHITVSMLPSSGSMPGYSNGREIFIYADNFRNPGSKETLVALHGLNYHELAHILFTPRTGGGSLVNRLQGANLWKSFNVLEDQRIETLFTAMYRPAMRYFAQMVIEFLVNDPKTWPLAHSVTYGRKFLPREIRDPFRELFAGSASQRRRIEEIIDEFRLLDLSPVPLSWTVNDQAFFLVKEYAEIIKKIMQENPSASDPTDEEGCAQQTEQTPNQSASEQASEQAKRDEEDRKEIEDENDGDASEFYDDDPEEEEGGDDEDGNSSGQDGSDEDENDQGSGDSNNDSDPTDGDDEAGSAEGKDGSSDDDSDSDGEDDENGDLSDGSGAGVGGSDQRSTRELQDEISQALQDAQDEIEQNPQVNEDVRRTKDAMLDPGNLPMNAPPSKGAEMKLTPEMVSASESAAREFRRLYSEFEPGWQYGSDQGRVNVQRAILDPENLDEMFDEWDEGKELDAGLEIFIALDTSGSMHLRNRYVDASQALWEIRKSVSDLPQAKITAVSFDSETQLLYGKGDVVKTDCYDLYDAEGGDTQPLHSFRLAARTMDASEMANKLFIIITDGTWGSDDEENDVIGNTGTGRYSANVSEKLQEIEATRMFFGIGSGCMYPDDFHIVAENQSASDLAPVIEKVINHMLEEARTRR